MPDPKDGSDYDQGAAFLADSLPPFWFRMFCNLKEVGFPNHEALEILKTYIAAQAGGKFQI